MYSSFLISISDIFQFLNFNKVSRFSCLDLEETETLLSTSTHQFSVFSMNVNILHIWSSSCTYMLLKVSNPVVTPGWCSHGATRWIAICLRLVVFKKHSWVCEILCMNIWGGPALLYPPLASHTRRERHRVQRELWKSWHRCTVLPAKVFSSSSP